MLFATQRINSGYKFADASGTRCLHIVCFRLARPQETLGQAMARTCRCENQSLGCRIQQLFGTLSSCEGKGIGCLQVAQIPTSQCTRAALDIRTRVHSSAEPDRREHAEPSPPRNEPKLKLDLSHDGLQQCSQHNVARSTSLLPRPWDRSLGALRDKPTPVARRSTRTWGSRATAADSAGCSR